MAKMTELFRFFSTISFFLIKVLNINGINIIIKVLKRINNFSKKTTTEHRSPNLIPSYWEYGW